VLQACAGDDPARFKSIKVGAPGGGCAGRPAGCAGRAASAAAGARRARRAAGRLGRPGGALPAQVRFSRHVFPGETLQVEMWREGEGLVVFQTRVVGRDVLAISNAAMELHPPAGARSSL
jgi:hypothetical protein